MPEQKSHPLYTPAQTYHLLTTYLGPTPIPFNPANLPQPFPPIFRAILEAYIADPHNTPARHTAFITALQNLSPQDTRTLEAYLQEGSIEHHAIKINLTHHHKSILRALFNIAPETAAQIAEYIYQDPGNTHRRLQSLIKKNLVLRTNHQSKILYHLNPTHFLAENPFPDPFQNLNIGQIIQQHQPPHP